MRYQVTPAVDAAIGRCQPDPAGVDLYTRAFLTYADHEVLYWAAMAKVLHGLIALVHNRHVRECTRLECDTCCALAEATSGYDAFNRAEQTRCTCPPDNNSRDSWGPLGPSLDTGHYTIDCVTRHIGHSTDATDGPVNAPPGPSGGAT